MRMSPTCRADRLPPTFSDWPRESSLGHLACCCYSGFENFESFLQNFFISSFVICILPLLLICVCLSAVHYKGSSGLGNFLLPILSFPWFCSFLHFLIFRFLTLVLSLIFIFSDFSAICFFWNCPILSFPWFSKLHIFAFQNSLFFCHVPFLELSYFQIFLPLAHFLIFRFLPLFTIFLFGDFSAICIFGIFWFFFWLLFIIYHFRIYLDHFFLE